MVETSEASPLHTDDVRKRNIIVIYSSYLTTALLAAPVHHVCKENCNKTGVEWVVH